MKKSRIGLIGALAFAGAVQAAPTINTQDKTNVVIQEKVPDQNNRRVRQNRELPPDGMGGISFPFYDTGRSPKEYGQWLQATGRQKWVKKRK